MQRRQFLAAAGTVSAIPLAGCFAGALDSDSNDGSTYPTLSVDADPLSGSGTVSVSVIREFGPEQPARLRIALTNDGDEALSAIFGTVPPFTDLHGDHTEGDARLLLVPTDDQRKRRVIPETPSDGAWRATGDVATNATAIMTEVPTGETVAQTYDLLAGPETDGLPTGDYRFEVRDYLGRETWGFTVSVSD
jgi:hypothetical protein